MALGASFNRSVAFAGLLATALASIGFEWLFEWLFRASLFRYSIDLVPIGAILLGVIGTSGGIWLARRLHVRLGVLDLVVMMGIGAATVIGIYLIGYITAIGGRGVHIPSVMSFEHFLPLAISQTHVYWNGSDTGAAGPWAGYALFSLQVAGCCAAYAIGFSILRRTPRCDRCQRYFDVVGKRTIGPFTHQATRDFLARARGASWTNYVAVIDSWRSVDLPPNTAQAQILIELRQCGECFREHLSELVRVGNGEKWQMSREGGRRAFLPMGISIRRVV